MKYTTEIIFVPRKFSGPHRTLVVKANGGKVEIFAPLDAPNNEWIKAGEYTSDSVDCFFHGSAPIKIVPSGGAEFNIY